jgi:molybdate transport system substrate-binding protein
MRTAVAVTLVALVCAGLPAGARSEEITVWSARALATVLAETGSEFTRETGHRLVVRSGLPKDFQQWARAGERFDVLITVAAPMDEWIRDGRVVTATRTDLARSGIGVAVKKGRPRPDIRTVAALKQTLLDAKSVAYLRVGSGLYLDGLLVRLGIADQVAAKSIRPETDIVAELVAKGEAELGVVVLTQILTTPGVELVGPFPAEVQSYITFAAGVSPEAAASDGATRLIAFLKGPRAAGVIRAQGMEPLP